MSSLFCRTIVSIVPAENVREGSVAGPGGNAEGGESGTWLAGVRGDVSKQFAAV